MGGLGSWGHSTSRGRARSFGVFVTVVAVLWMKLGMQKAERRVQFTLVIQVVLRAAAIEEAILDRIEIEINEEVSRAERGRV